MYRIPPGSGPPGSDGSAANDRGPGRPRDTGIDERVLEATRAQLAAHGYEALSVVAVAEAAGTTRQALYRRWPTKADLATAAVAAMAEAAVPTPTDDPFADLVAELSAFRRGISRPDGVSMVGTMLVSSTDADVVALFRARLVEPRRRRLRAVLHRARRAGLIDETADIDTALTTFTGSWYAAALAGTAAPRDWPRRIALLVWRGLGGTDPGAQEC